MATTYTLIASNTVNAGGVASITFSSIPQTYTDLCLKLSGRCDTGTNYRIVILSVNNLTSSSDINLYGAVTSVASGTDAAVYLYMDAAGATANTFGNAEVYIPNYTSTNNKSLSADMVTENNTSTASTALTMFTAGLLTTSNAINSLTLTPTAGNFAQYSTAYLYGIKNS